MTEKRVLVLRNLKQTKIRTSQEASFALLILCDCLASRELCIYNIRKVRISSASPRTYEPYSAIEKMWKAKI